MNAELAAPRTESAADWALAPDVDFLNHGSFGACPLPVLDEQRRWQLRFERAPVAFVLGELEGALDEARREVAAFVGCRPEGLAFVTNPTTGVGAVLASSRLNPGDEVLVTNHGYNACKNSALYWASRAGARVVVADVPFPVSDESAIVSAPTTGSSSTSGFRTCSRRCSADRDASTGLARRSQLTPGAS